LLESEEVIAMTDTRNRIQRLALAMALTALAVSALSAQAYVLLDGKWHDPQLPVPWRMNTFQDEPTVPGGDEFNDVRTSFLNWENLPNAKVAFQEGAPVTTANPCALTTDFQNVVSFRDCGNNCTGSCIGVTSSVYDLGCDYYAGGLGSLRRIDSDIVFGKQWSWITLPTAQGSGCSGRMIVQSIATHEIGHLIGMGHSPIAGSTMFASTTFCDQNPASLAPDDIAGAEALYSFNVPTYEIGVHDVNSVRLGVTNCGNVGLPGGAAAGNGNTGIGGGAGFQFPVGTNHMFEGSFIIGKEAVADTNVSDDFRWQGTAVGYAQDADFVPLGPLTLSTPGGLADQESVSEFDDSAANRVGVPTQPTSGTVPLGVRVRAETYAWSSAPDAKYVICLFRITNTTGSTLNGVIPGLIFDWDFTGVNYLTNSVAYDGANKLGYVSDPSTVNRAGVRVLNIEGVRSFRAIGMSGAGAEIHTNTTKHNWLISGFTQTALGPADIGFLIASGPFNIGAGQTVKCAFAICAGTSQADLVASGVAAQAKYDALLSGSTSVAENSGVLGPVYELRQNTPNPFNPTTRIAYRLPEAGNATLRVYNLQGERVRTLIDGPVSAGAGEVTWDGRGDDGQPAASGTYFYELRVGDRLVQSRKMQLLK
jgi:hypothetical protein